MNGVKFAIASLPEEAVLGLDGHQVLVAHVARLGVDLLRQADVEVADGVLLHLSSSLSGLTEETNPADGFIIRILDPNIEGKTILSECMEFVEKLVSRFGDGEEVTHELQVVSFAFQDFHVP